MSDAPRRSAKQWRDIAYLAIPRFVTARGGAVLWPEVEAQLAHRNGWLREHAPDIGPANHLDPHILGVARDLLLESDIIRAQTVNLTGRAVTAYVESDAYIERRATKVDRLAGQKRRRYRSVLGWTSDAKLCGQIAERHIAATLESLKGEAVWLPYGSGEVREVDGQHITGGLDHAGHIALNPINPEGGWVPFLVEDKNVRAKIYPYHIEVWDLLCKAAAFPRYLPILIAPRIHYTTFRLFRAIGAIGIPTTRQWFAPDPAIPTDKFNRAISPLGLRGDAAQLANPDQPSGQIRDFFSKTMQRVDPDSPDDGSLIERSQKLWVKAAPILASAEFAELRSHDLADRRGTYRKVLDELYAEGFEVEDLLPRHVIYPDEPPDEDDVDWRDYVDED